jgi:hypothetical protein
VRFVLRGGPARGAARSICRFSRFHCLTASVHAREAHHDGAEFLVRNDLRSLWSDLVSHSAKAIAVLGAGVVLMMLTRPQGSYVLPVLFGIVAVLVWRRALTALIGAVLVVATVWAVQTADKIRIGSQNFAGSFESSHTTGAMLLFSLYLDGIRANIHISPENGPRSTELEALLLDELAKPDTLARRSGYLTSVPSEGRSRIR